MARELFILRHAKSDWGVTFDSDFVRPLSTRGEKDAPRMGKWMRKHECHPELILSSSATRARQTVLAVCRQLDITEEKIEFSKQLYLASLRTLLAVLAGISRQYNSVMLVGHNPGLDDLVSSLCQEPPPLTDSGKLMTTACLAHFGLPDDWNDLKQRGELLAIIRPGELDG